MQDKNKVPAKKVIVKNKTSGKTENNQISSKKTAGGRSYITKGGNGGARKGSGRKKGSATKKTREIANAFAEDGELLPLTYMLQVMRTTDEDLKKQFDAGDLDISEYMVKLETNQRRRDNAAEKAAPYIHPKLTSVTADINQRSHEVWLNLME